MSGFKTGMARNTLLILIALVLLALGLGAYLMKRESVEVSKDQPPKKIELPTLKYSPGSTKPN